MKDKPKINGKRHKNGKPTNGFGTASSIGSGFSSGFNGHFSDMKHPGHFRPSNGYGQQNGYGHGHHPNVHNHSKKNGVTNVKSQMMMGTFNTQLPENPAINLMTHSSDQLNGVNRAGRMFLQPPSVNSSDVLMWTTEDGSKRHCIIRKTRILQNPDSWDQILDVHELTLEDEDRQLKKLTNPRFSEMKHLYCLNVRWSSLTVVPLELAHLNIRYFGLPRNKLTSIDGITDMVQLVELDLTCNTIKHISPELGNLVNLRVANFTGNKISSLPESIGNLSKLEELHLASNSLSALPYSVCELKKLKLLDVSLNIINELPTDIGKLDNLIELRASGNRLYSLPDSIKHCTNIQYIHMRNNQFSQIPSVLKYIDKLETVNFRHNIINKMDYPLPGVKVLLLDINRLVKVPSAVMDSSTLEVLSMESNDLRDIPNEIGKLHRLRSLNVDRNRISMVPEQLCDMKELRHLSLKSTRVKSLPANVVAMNRLTVLDINDTDVQLEVASKIADDMPNVQVGCRSYHETSNYGRASDDYD